MFSVVIPLYNKRPFIRRAVSSVLAQSHTDFELVVVDDGSTDGSCEALLDLEDDRLRVIRQDNTGEGAARNRGIAEAQSDWVAFLDADDFWFPDNLEELGRIIELHPGSGLVSTASIQVADGEPVSQPHQDKPTIRSIDYFREAARSVGLVNSSSAAIRREVFSKLGGFGPFKAGADLECWARVALHYPVAVSNKVTAVYCRGTGGVTEQATASIGQNLPPVRTLPELSPSVSLLCKALSDPKHRRLAASIEAYINSRVLSGVRASLARGDVPRARAVAALFLGRASLGWRLLKGALRMPPPFVLALVSAWRFARRAYR